MGGVRSFIAFWRPSRALPVLFVFITGISAMTACSGVERRGGPGVEKGEAEASVSPAEREALQQAQAEAERQAKREAQVRAHSRTGFAALSEGRLGDARRAWRKILDLNPDHAPTLSNLGMVEARLGNPEEAIRHARRATRLDPHSPAFSVNYGLLLEANERGAEAVAYYRRALDLDAAFKPAWLALGARALGGGDPVEAERHYSDALKHHPTSAEAMAGWAAAVARLDRWDEAAERMEEAFRVDENRAVWAAAAGALHFRLGNTARAEAMMDAALALDPGLTDALVLRAELAWVAADYVQARALYQRAVTLDTAGPDLAGSLLRRGELEKLLDRPDLAEESFRGSLRQDGQIAAWRSQAHARLGIIALKRGEYREALQLFRVADDEGGATGLSLAGRAQATHGLAWQGREEERDGRLQEAEGYYRAALEEEENTRLRLALGRLYMQRAELVDRSYRRGQLHQAEVQLELVLREHPELAEVHLRLARLYEQLERISDARRHYDRLLELDPLSSRSVFLYANMLRRQGEANRDRALYAEAHGYFGRAMALDPSYVPAQVGWYLTRTSGSPDASTGRGGATRAGVDPELPEGYPAPAPDSEPGMDMDKLPPELEDLIPFLEDSDPFVEDPFDEGFRPSPDTIPIKENDMDPLYRIEGSDEDASFPFVRRDED